VLSDIFVNMETRSRTKIKAVSLLELEQARNIFLTRTKLIGSDLNKKSNENYIELRSTSRFCWRDRVLAVSN